jgi:hypothetical protein
MARILRANFNQPRRDPGIPLMSQTAEPLVLLAASVDNLLRKTRSNGTLMPNIGNIRREQGGLRKAARRRGIRAATHGLARRGEADALRGARLLGEGKKVFYLDSL